MRNDLYEYIKRYETGVSSLEVTLFLENNKPMRSAHSDVTKTRIKRALVDMCLNVFGSEPDDTYIDAATTNIYRQYDSLSVEDVEFVCEQMKLGNIDPIYKKEFNPTGMLKLLFQFQGRKKIIQSAYNRLKRNENESESGRIKAEQFLQNAKNKFGRGEKLTCYERSALGKAFAEQMSPEVVSVVREKARLSYPEARKKVEIQREIYYDSAFNPDKENSSLIDEDMNFPMILAEQTHFGMLMFEEYNKLNTKT